MFKYYKRSLRRLRISRSTLPLLVVPLICASLVYAAVPRGTVVLNPGNYFQSSTFYCGFVRGRWIPGRMLAQNRFYSRTAERQNLLKAAKSAAGRKKKQLLKRARSLLGKLQGEKPFCAAGPETPAPTATATPAETAITTPSATPTRTPVPLATVNAGVSYTEHCLFIIPDAGQVTWSGSSSWESVYATANIDSYVRTLKDVFPGDYFFVVVAAANLLPNRVPNVLTYRYLASGIGEDGITGVGVPNICRYHMSGTATEGSFGVLDHEIGHNWGVFIGLEVGSGHWLSNSTATGQMAEFYSEDSYETVRRITGSPAEGFRWESISSITDNETSTFSDQDLYLQGFASTFPAVHVLTSPVYNPDGTLSYSSVATYDQAWVVARNGARSPGYQTSEKRLRMGCVYVARDQNEVLQSHAALERSMSQFVNSEEINTVTYRFQVPFLVATKYRASINALLADLNGNTTPTLSITGPGYTVAAGGSAVIPFAAADADGPAPTVSCVPASANCSISGTNALVSGLSSGSHFFTIKAQDDGGKKTFAHFVVDVP